MVAIPDLFRGDSLPSVVLAANAASRGRTFAEHYSTDGLMAKFGDGGRGAWLKWPLQLQVATHVGYRQSEDGEVAFAYRSPFISFSDDRKAAWHFLDRTGEKTFTDCALADATHFMWRMAGLTAVEIGVGHFAIEFRASTANVDHFLQAGVAEFLVGDYSNLKDTLSQSFTHLHVQADDSLHTAQLIHVPRYLAAVTESSIPDDLLARARGFGAKWSEWLVLPTDVEAGLGRSSRLPLNAHLDLCVFAREAR